MLPGRNGFVVLSSRMLIAALAGALAGAGGLSAAYMRRPGFAHDMDRDMPRRVASGFFPVEQFGDTTFAWTSRRADVRLAGLDRTTAWACSVRVRGGRSDPGTQPTVDFAIDGISVATSTASNEFQEMQGIAPPRAAAGLILTITSSRTVVPGPSDPRELGIQVDRLRCEPVAARARPPSESMRNAALSSAFFGASLALAGLPLGLALCSIVVLAALQAVPLSSGPAPYTGFSATMTWFALWIAGSALAIVRVLDRLRTQRLQQAARFVVLFSAGVLYLELAGLLHPSKLLVDAVFHAHRLEWVLAGRYYFTQPMPGGVSFPYAIGLYVFAAPWSIVVRDHVTLLRVVVCASHVIAGALLYPLIARAWSNRTAGAMAVVLFAGVPLPFGLIGNANLTNAFGQSAALVTLIAASTLAPRPGRVAPVIALFLLCALAVLSHVSTCALLVLTLVALAVFYRWRGGTSLHRTAWTLLAVTAAAVLVAWLLYYGHFTEVYRTALRVRAEAPAALSTTEPVTAPMAGRPALPVQARLANALAFTVTAIGWPILLLAAVGVWRVWAGAMRDRAVWLIAAWGVAYVAFLGVAVMRVDAPFQRYAAEFFGRVLLATYPAAVMLAGLGTSWAWSANYTTRTASAGLLLAAIVVGVQHWTGWFM